MELRQNTGGEPAIGHRLVSEPAQAVGQRVQINRHRRVDLGVARLKVERKVAVTCMDLSRPLVVSLVKNHDLQNLLARVGPKRATGAKGRPVYRLTA